MWAINPYFSSSPKQSIAICDLEKRGAKQRLTFENSSKLKRVPLDKLHIEREIRVWQLMSCHWGKEAGLGKIFHKKGYICALIYSLVFLRLVFSFAEEG